VSADVRGPVISIADFAIPAKKVAIYVAGAAFHAGIRLRRDRIIREQLRLGSAAWRRVEFKAEGLRATVGTISRIRDML